MLDSDNLFMIDADPSSYWWTAQINGVKFGDDAADAWGLDEIDAFTDSGTSCIIVPNKYYDWFLD